MNTTSNTVLITGGGSGIGYETAKLFSEKGNQVIITGRNKAKLEAAASSLKNTTAIVSDVNNAEEVEQLVTRIKNEFPALNILVNNAGKAFAYRLSGDAGAFEKAVEEMTTNYLSIVRLTEKLLPLLSAQKQAAIINISSIVSFVPGASLPTYSASKAALHSYSQILRLTLSQSTVKVYEMMPPLVDTEFARELPGHKMQPEAIAAGLINGLENEIFEMHPGATAAIYQSFLSSPQQALRQLNGVN